MERTIKIMTGVGGFELFNEAMEEIGLGKKRIYMGKKAPRFLKSMRRVRKSLTGRYYVLVRK